MGDVGDNGQRWQPIFDMIADALADGGMEGLHARAEAEARARPGPWRWYCRECGARGDRPSEDERDTAARGHLTDTACGRHEVTGWESSGKLLHVWTYPASAVAQWN